MGLFIDHVNYVLGNLRETSIAALSTDNATIAFRVQEAVKNAVFRVWNARQWRFKERITTFATVSGTEEYSLPITVGEIYKFLSSDTPYDMVVIGERDFDRRVPNPTSTGNPEYVRLFETTGVNTQPTSASVITVVSSSAADTTQTVLVKGLVSGEVDYEAVTLNGTTDVVTTKSFSRILSVTKSAATAGRVTLTSNVGVVTNAIIAPQNKTIRYKRIKLYPQPTSALTITVKHYGLPLVLTHAYEDTEIPERWDYVVNQFAFALALETKGKDQLEEFITQMDKAKAFLDEDMASEEGTNSEKTIIPEKFTGTLMHEGWTALPAGYGYVG